jgi:hypothetical protein
MRLVVPVAVAVLSPLSPSLSPSELLVSTPHEQSLATGCGRAVRAHRPAIVALVPSPQCPRPRCLRRRLGCSGGGGRYRPRRPLAVVVVVRWGVLGCPCLRWCPCPHPLSLSLSPPCPAPLSLSSLSSFCPLPVVPILVAPCVHPASRRSRWRSQVRWWYLVILSPSSFCCRCLSSHPTSTLRAVARNGGGEGWVVPLSCPFLSLASLLSVSTLRAVARSGSAGCWIPRGLGNTGVAGAYLVGTYCSGLPAPS